METTELKELYKWAQEGKPVEEIYGVTIEDFDPDFISPPDKLKFIGLVAELNDEKNGFSYNLVDLIISYLLEGVHVLLEMPCDMVKNFDVKELMFTIKNLQVSFAVLPPEHPLVKEPVSIEEYKALMGNITQELLNQSNYPMKVYPVSNYIIYMMLEIILGDKIKDVFTVTEDYVLNNYVKHMEESDSDLFKEEIRKVVYNHYNGEAEFKKIASVVVNSICDLSKNRFKESVNKYIQDEKIKREDYIKNLSPKKKAQFLREEKREMLKNKKAYKRNAKEKILKAKRGLV